MKEEFTTQWSRDFRQRYNHSYGFYTTPAGKRVLVHMQAVDDGVAEFVDIKGNHYSANADAGVEFEFIPVKKKLFICGDVLMLQRRNAARMWARGINNQNTTMRDVVTGEDRRLSFSLVSEAMEPEQYKVFANSKYGHTIILMSDLFAIHGPAVYLYDRVIGAYDAIQHCITLDSPLFVQEMKDLLVKLNLNWSVKNG